MKTTMWAALAVAASGLLLGGCQAFTPTTQLDADAASLQSDQRNTFRLASELWQGTSQVPMSYTEIGGPDGINTLNASNPGAASITPEGVAIASPNPTKAAKIDYKREIPLRDELGAPVLGPDGQPVILTDSVLVEGFESKPELVLQATTEAIRVQVGALETLYRTNGEQYAAQISALREAIGPAADIIDAGIRALNPVPLP